MDDVFVNKKVAKVMIQTSIFKDEIQLNSKIHVPLLWNFHIVQSHPAGKSIQPSWYCILVIVQLPGATSNRILTLMVYISLHFRLTNLQIWELF